MTPAAYDRAAASFGPNLQLYLDAIADRDRQLADARRRSQELCAGRGSTARPQPPPSRASSTAHRDRRPTAPFAPHSVHF
jgi:hypothetical protein